MALSFPTTFCSNMSVCCLLASHLNYHLQSDCDHKSLLIIDLFFGLSPITKPTDISRSILSFFNFACDIHNIKKNVTQQQHL